MRSAFARQLPDERGNKRILLRFHMTVNFDFLVSGCNTRCKHCYVNGGPGGMMAPEDALLFIEKLDSLAALLPFKASLTLDNEPMNHPDIASILRKAAVARHIENYHHGMTSGIALMRRKDRQTVMQAYLDCGYSDFGITLHGNARHHDEIVRREGAFQTAVEAAEFMKSCGAEVGVSLMFNRFFAGDAGEIDGTLRQLQPAYIYFAVPNFTPHAHMTDFELCRGSLDTFHRIRPWLASWRQREDEWTREVCTIGMLREQFGHGLDPAALFRQPQDELYMTVHPNGDLFVGNTGVETERLGNLRTLDLQETAKYISGLPGNRDYGAFYEENLLPCREELIRAAEQLPQDLLYSDRASAIYRVLTALGIPTKILDEAN